MISNRAGRTGVWLLSALMTLAASVPVSALTPNGPHPEPQSQREVLLNGLPIVTQQLPGDRVAVACAVRSGAMFDPAGKSGLASITGRLLAAGAGSYTGERILAEIDEAGGRMQIVTDWDATWITADAPASKLSVLLDVVSLMVTSPRFAPEDFAAVKKEYVERARAELADADTAADLALVEALYGKHTYGRLVDGDPASIEAITLGDVKVFYEKFYLANTAVLSVAGPVSKEAVQQLAKPRFGRWNMGNAVPATFLPPQRNQASTVVLVDRPEVADARIRVGYISAGRSDDTAGAVTVLRAVTEAELRMATGRADASVSYAPRMLQGPFVVSHSVPASDVARSLKLISDTLRGLAGGKPIPPTSSMGAAGPVNVIGDAARRAAEAEFYERQGMPADVLAGHRGSATVTAAAARLFTPAAAVVVLGSAAELRPELEAAGFSVEVRERR